MTEAELADANYVEAFREHARWQEPCELLEERGVLLVAGANAFPGLFRNCAVRVDPGVPAQPMIEHARDFFARRSRAFIVLVRESRDADLERALQSSGLAPIADAPCMLIDAPIAAKPEPAGIRVERFSEEHHIRDAVEVNAEAYEALKLPAAEARMYFNRPAGALSPRVTGFVAYRDARPVATALTIHGGANGGKAAGIYWVGTAASERRSGLGELCTRLSTNAGFERGASIVTLQASPFGEPVYKRLGYRTYDRSRRYRVAAPD